MKIRIKLHSATDLITNSSTVIFTYSEQSKKACESMIDEIFKAFGIDKTCDDVFELSVGLENNDCYATALERMQDDGEPEPKGLEGFYAAEYGEQANSMLDSYLQQVQSGKIKKPEWMKEAEGGEDYDGYAPSTMLTITPKDPKHKKLAKMVEAFLYSTSHEATRNG
jgi:hypothetical protein